MPLQLMKKIKKFIEIDESEKKSLSEAVKEGIISSKYKLPLKENEIEEILESVQEYYEDFKKLENIEEDSNSYKTTTIIGKLRANFYKYGENTQQLIALALSGLLEFKFEVLSIDYDEREEYVFLNEYIEVLNEVVIKLEEYLNNPENNNKEAFKKLKVIYKKLHEESKKHALRKLIEIDIKYLDKDISNIVKDAMQLNEDLYLVNEEIMNNIKDIKEYVINCINENDNNQQPNQAIFNALLYDVDKKYCFKKYEEALVKSDEFLDVYPQCKDKDKFRNRGYLRYKLKQYRQSIKEYTKAIEIDENDLSLYLARGNVYMHLEENENAVKDYTKAIEIDENCVYALSCRGLAYSQIGQMEESLKDYTKIIEIDENYENIYFEKGNVYFKMGKMEDAIKEYTKEIQKGENFDNAYNKRGDAYLQLEKYEKAIEDYTKAIEINKNCLNAYYNRGIAYKKIGKIDIAIMEFLIADEKNNYDSENKDKELDKALRKEINELVSIMSKMEEYESFFGE